MKISCDIIRDLLPLYYDDVCSEDTKKMIEEHIGGCPDCRSYLDDLREIGNDSHTTIINEERAKGNTLKKIKRSIFRKNVIIAICVGMLTAGFVSGGYMYIVHHDTPIEYDESIISVEEFPSYSVVEGGKAGVEIQAVYKGNNLYSTNAYEAYVTKDGKKVFAKFIQYTDTIWTRYRSDKTEKSDDKFPLSENSFITDAYEIPTKVPNPEVVYYVPASIDLLEYTSPYEKQTKERNQELADKSIVIWEKDKS